MSFENLSFEPGTAGLITAMVALQQANGIDFDVAVARVEATLDSGAVWSQSRDWNQLIRMLRWLAAPPVSQEPLSITH